jgi:hypothetical protein
LDFRSRLLPFFGAGTTLFFGAAALTAVAALPAGVGQNLGDLVLLVVGQLEFLGDFLAGEGADAFTLQAKLLQAGSLSRVEDFAQLLVGLLAQLLHLLAGFLEAGATIFVGGVGIALEQAALLFANLASEVFDLAGLFVRNLKLCTDFLNFEQGDASAAEAARAATAPSLLGVGRRSDQQQTQGK